MNWLKVFESYNLKGEVVTFTHFNVIFKNFDFDFKIQLYLIAVETNKHG